MTKDHAVVIGAGIAGLLAARVLSGHFSRVTVVDRDVLAQGPHFRRGIPQSRHQHIFLPRGRQIAERLFPGFESGLVAAGAVPMDLAGDGHWLTPCGMAPRFNSGIGLLGCTRDLLEWVVRERVASLPNVRFVDRTDVARLLPGAARMVGGVATRPHGSGGEGCEGLLPASLVVDASGRNSRAPQWLQSLGHVPPEETAINAHPGYATRLFERPTDVQYDWTFLLLQTAPPDHSRGGALLAVEGGRWMCSLIGLGSDHPPTDEAGFLAFARSLRSSLLYEAIKGARPLSSIHGFRKVENRRRRYDRLANQPGNLLVTGDAVCAFNPIYGQGMTAAALGAEILEGCLDGWRGDGDLARRFQRRLARATATPWMLATGEDLRVPEVEGGAIGPSTRLAQHYFDRVLALSLRDLALRRALLEVFGMVRPPSALFSPSVLAKVARGIFAGHRDMDQAERLRRQGAAR